MMAVHGAPRGLTAVLNQSVRRLRHRWHYNNNIIITYNTLYIVK